MLLICNLHCAFIACVHNAQIMCTKHRMFKHATYIQIAYATCLYCAYVYVAQTCALCRLPSAKAKNVQLLGQELVKNRKDGDKAQTYISGSLAGHTYFSPHMKNTEEKKYIYCENSQVFMIRCQDSATEFPYFLGILPKVSLH